MANGLGMLQVVIQHFWRNPGWLNAGIFCASTKRFRKHCMYSKYNEFFLFCYLHLFQIIRAYSKPIATWERIANASLPHPIHAAKQVMLVTWDRKSHKGLSPSLAIKIKFINYKLSSWAFWVLTWHPKSAVSGCLPIYMCVSWLYFILF